MTSEEMTAALGAAALIEPCPDCSDELGLCASDHCRRQVLPVLKEPSLARDAHSGMYHEARVYEREETPAVKKAKRRNRRREEKATERFARALDGEFTRTQRSKAA